MPQLTRPTGFPFAVPGVHPGMTAIAAPGTFDGHWYIAGRAISYGVPSRNDGSIVRSVTWPAPGLILTDGHDGPPIGRACVPIESPTGLDVLFRIDENSTAQSAVMRAAISGEADLSIGAFTEPTTGTHHLYEVALVDRGAYPGTHVYGVFTPLEVYTRIGDWLAWTGHGPRASAETAAYALVDPLERIDYLVSAFGPRPSLAGDYALLRELAALRETAKPTAPAPPDDADTGEPAELVESRGAESMTVPLELLEVRSTAAGVHILEGICVPYNRVSHRAPTPELFRPGAFDGRIPKKVWLRDHNHAQDREPVAKAVALTERTDGLYGRFEFLNTPQGTAAFENVREGVYEGLSVGFRAVRTEHNAGIREIHAARLDHVALAEIPSYEDAAIINIR